VGFTDRVQVKYDTLMKELEAFIEVLQCDRASMVRTQEQATRMLNVRLLMRRRKKPLFS